jgi:cbb3-type cytochrome oxidase subunit 1
MLTLALAFLAGAYVESKFATLIELAIAKVVGLVHAVIGAVVGAWNALKGIFTHKAVAAPAVDAAPVAAPAPAAQPTDTPAAQ